MIPRKILIVDDHPFIRLGIISTLLKHPGFTNILEAENGLQAVELIYTINPQIVLMDISLPDISGFEVATQVYQSGISKSNTRILFISIHHNFENCYRAYKCGGYGLIGKETCPNDLIDGITAIEHGEYYFGSGIDIAGLWDVFQHLDNACFTLNDPDTIKLTKREEDVLFYIYRGMKNKEIAERLQISERTVETHRASLMHKFGAKSVVELTVRLNNSERLKHFFVSSVLEIQET